MYIFLAVLSVIIKASPSAKWNLSLIIMVFKALRDL